MSGGSYDYAYQKVDSMADELLASVDPIRAAFAEHLKLVSRAMYAIEWVDSGDNAPGYEIAAIRACTSPVMEIDAAIRRAKEAARFLSFAISASSKWREIEAAETERS